MQVKEENGNYICLKHNQMIQLIVMDTGVQPADQMLCYMCVSLNRQPLNQVMGIEQAKEMIKEKLNQKITGQEERITLQVNRLRKLQQNMVELRQQLLMNINIIIIRIEQWISEISQSIKKETPDLIKGIQLLQQEKAKGEQNNSNIMKIDTAFKKLLNINGIKKNYSDLINIKNELNAQIIKITQQSNSQYKINRQQDLISHILVGQVKQGEHSNALAFNDSGQIMIAGSKQDIKVWQFDKGHMTQLNILKGELNWISCLIFSKKHQWFVSGDNGGNIRIWEIRKKNSDWFCHQAEKKHTRIIRCIILTNSENQLLSCSDDKSIIVWNVNYQTTQISYQYSLENKHFNSVNGLSLNESEKLLVSCGVDKQLVLWTKGSNSKWIYKQSVQMPNSLSRVCFMDENYVLVQQNGQGFTNIFKVVNSELKEFEDLKIELNIPQENIDFALFPPIYNKSKEIIIWKSHTYVYIIRKLSDGSFKVEGQPIQFETDSNYGNLTLNGEYLVIWNQSTKEFRIYKIMNRQ